MATTGDSENNLESYQETDATDQGWKDQFMTIDSWNQDGNYYAQFDDFGPEMQPEGPPTHNGKPMD